MQTDLLLSTTKAASSAVHAAQDTLAAGTASGATSSSAPFAGVFADAMSNLKGLEDQASSATEGLLRGRQVDIHAAMIATQKSDLAFEMALAVRGKVVSAYQSIMGVQF